MSHFYRIFIRRLSKCRLPGLVELAWLQGTVRHGAHSVLSDCSGYHPVKICVVSEDGNFTTFLGNQKVKKQKG